MPHPQHKDIRWRRSLRLHLLHKCGIWSAIPGCSHLLHRIHSPVRGLIQFSDITELTVQTRLLELLNAIDEAVEQEDHSRALQLILNNWYNLPDPAPLRERTAMLLATVGRKREAVEVYSRVARHYANAGFPTRSLAAIKQMQSLNPSSTQLLDHFTTLYSVRSPFLERDLQQPTIPNLAAPPELELSQTEDTDELFSQAVERATDPEGTAERPGSLPALPLMSLLPPKALRRLLDFVEYEIYAEVQPVITAEDRPKDRDLFWAVSSDLIAHDDDEQFIIPAGTLLGVSAFRAQPAPPKYRVTSQKGSECLRLSRTAVEELTQQFGDLPNRLATLYRHALTKRLFERHPMFAELDEQAIEKLPTRLTGLRLDSETIFIKQNKVSPGLYILLDGSADVVRQAEGTEVTIETLQPGDMIGEIGLVEPRPTVATAITNTACHLLFCPRDDFVEFAARHPSMQTFAENRARQRIEFINEKLSDSDLEPLA